MSWLDFREQVSAWTHLVWFLLSVPATAALWRRARGGWAKRLSFLVYGLSMGFCFLASTLYHGVRVPPDQVERVFATLDYVGIFLLIAGTVTPAAVVVLRGRWRWFVLGLAWLLAGVGIAVRLVLPAVPESLSNGFYLGMGWAVLLCYFELARRLSHRSLRLAILGGVFYSLGAVFNWVKWPRLWPGVFSAHELLHVCDMAGSLCHFWFLLKVVAPFGRPRVPSPADKKSRRRAVRLLTDQAPG